MNISVIAAVSRHRVLGSGNKLLWHISEDFKWFRAKTKGSIVVMGRKTYDSIGKPLVKRENYILTQNKNYIAPDKTNVLYSVDDFLDTFRNTEDEIFIIGGGKIYKQIFPYINKMYLTIIDITVDGDVFFPKINFKQWEHIYYRESSDNNYEYTFNIFERKSPGFGKDEM